MRVYKEFHFEAAHCLPGARPDHPNARVHGHSFRVRVTVEGEPDAEAGVVVPFDELEQAVSEARHDLDHRFLNDVEGLANPTLEHIARWLWERLHNKLPGLAEIVVARDTCREGCVYSGPDGVPAR